MNNYVSYDYSDIFLFSSILTRYELENT